jgi:hypothetical protein
VKGNNSHLELWEDEGWVFAVFWCARSPNVNEQGDISELFVRLGRVR